MYQSDLELVSSFLYPHEISAFENWRLKLKQGCSKSEALAYYEACSVMLETLRKRLERYSRDGSY